MKLIRFLTNEIRELAARGLYFLIGFALILIILKLFLEEYSIQFNVVSKALLGALMAAKTVLLVEQTGMSRRRRPQPGYINVLYKTSICTLMALLLGILERLIEAFSKTKVMATAFETAIHSTNFNHFLAVILLISLIFLVYNIIEEINLYLGEGTLKNIFFSKPK